MIDLPLSNSMLISPRELSLSAWLGHIPFASWLVEQLKPRSIVELGTHRGCSFLAFCQAVQEQVQATRVFAVDTWEGDEHAGHYGDEIYEQLRQYQQRNYAGISELLRMRFDQALPCFANGSVDLLHIDGLHTYEAVREDFESWLPKLSDRAVVLFHDTCVRERGFGVWQYWSEISQEYPAFEFTHTHGLGVLLVGPRRVPVLEALAGHAAAGTFAPIDRLFDVLGSNIRRAEEIERVNAGLVDARGEVSRLGTLGHQIKQRCDELEEQLRSQGETERRLEQRCAELDEQLRGERELGRQLEQRRAELDEQLRGERELGRQLKLRCRELEAQLDGERGRSQADLEQERQAHARSEQEADRLRLQLQHDRETQENLRSIVADERAKAVESLTAALAPPLEALDGKLNLLLRPWWRR